jgi:hypothetical protein
MKLYRRFDRNGKLLSPFWWTVFGANGHVYRQSTKQENKDMAETVAHQLMAKVGADPNALKRTPRLDEELKRFEEWVENNQELRPNSIEGYQHGISMLRKSRLRLLPLDRINKDVVAATPFPGGPSNANTAIKTLRRLMGIAHEAGRLPALPKLKTRKENKRTLTLTDDIEAQMLPLLPRDTQFVIQFVRDTGARPQATRAPFKPSPLLRTPRLRYQRDGRHRQRQHGR